MADFLSDLSAANSQDSGGAATASGDFMSQLSAAHETDKGTPAPELKGDRPYADVVMRGLANSIPFMADISAAGDTATSYLPQGVKSFIPGINQQDQSGEPIGQRYSENLARQRAIDQADASQYPITSTLAPIAGAVAALPVAGPIDALSGGLSRAVPAISGLAADTLASGAVGAGYGALYGAGSGDSLSDRVSGAESGALYGGVLGAAVPAISRGVGSVARAAVIPFKGPEAAATNKIAESITADRALGNSALSPGDFAAAQTAGQPAVTADIGGQTTRRLARTAANASPEADAALQGVINPRYEDQGPRVADFLKGVYGNNLDAQAARDALTARASSINSPAYAKAYADGANGVWTPELETIINSPNVQSAIKGATQTAANDAVLTGTPVVRNPFVPDAQGNLTLRTDPQGNRAVPTLQFWDYVKRGLDDQIGAAFSSGQKSSGAQLVGLKNQLLSSLDAAVPSYATARQGAFQMFGAQNALEAGENFLRLANTADTAQAKAALAAMTPVQQKLFSQGLASQMAQTALNASARRNVLNMFNSPETAQRLQMGLGPTVAPQVEAFLRRESAMDMLRTAVSGNSTTAKQGSDLEKAGHGLLGMAKSAVTSPIAGAAVGAGEAYREHGFDPEEIGKYAIAGAFTGALGRYAKGVNAKLMASIGEQLASPDPTKVNAAIKKLSQNPRMMNALRATEKGLTYLAATRGAALAPQGEQSPISSYASGGRVAISHNPKAA